MSDTQTQTETTSESAETSKRHMSLSVLDNGNIRADFDAGVESIEFAPGDLPESILPAAVAEGLMSRLRSYTSRLNGAGRTPEALRKAIAQGVEDLRNGVWTRTRAEGIGEISQEAEAAHVFRQLRAAAKGETYTGTLEDDVKAFRDLGDEQKKLLKATDLYKTAMAKVKADRAAKTADKLSKKEVVLDDSVF